MPMLKKARRIEGKNIFLRDVTEDDAAFIFNLRSDPVKRQFISAGAQTVEDQAQWLRGYAGRTDQAYFIICDKNGERLGCLRMYDADERSYCWGSWLMVSGLSPLVSMESVLLLYAYGKLLGFTDVRVDARKDNTYVWRFHEKFSAAVLVEETDLDRFYEVKGEVIDALLAKYAHLVPQPLDVTY